DAIDLVANFTGSEIADQAHGGRHAEPAAHRAADLGRDAESAAEALAGVFVLDVKVGHVDRLDQLAVPGAQPVLARAVARLLHLVDGQSGQPRLARQPL